MTHSKSAYGFPLQVPRPAARRGNRLDIHHPPKKGRAPTLSGSTLPKEAIIAISYSVPEKPAVNTDGPFYHEILTKEAPLERTYSGKRLRQNSPEPLALTYYPKSI